MKFRNQAIFICFLVANLLLVGCETHQPIKPTTTPGITQSPTSIVTATFFPTMVIPSMTPLPNIFPTTPEVHPNTGYWAGAGIVKEGHYNPLSVSFDVTAGGIIKNFNIVMNIPIQDEKYTAYSCTDILDELNLREDGSFVYINKRDDSDISSIYGKIVNATSITGVYNCVVGMWESNINWTATWVSSAQANIIASLSVPGKYSTQNLMFSPKGKILAAGTDYGINLWDTVSHTLIQTLKVNRVNEVGNSFWANNVTDIAFSPDGTTLASAAWDNAIDLWDVASASHLQTLSGHSNTVTSVAFAPNGKTLASGSWDKSVILWNAANGKQLYRFDGHKDIVLCVAFSPNGKILASGARDNTIILWDVTNRKQLRTLSGHTTSLRGVAFAPDGKTLASESSDATVILWDVASGDIIRTFSDHSERRFHSHSPQSTWLGVGFSPNGKILISGAVDNSVILWDVASGNQLRILLGKYDYDTMAFSPRKNEIAVSSLGVIDLWEIIP